MKKLSKKVVRLNGSVEIPADKSISHRALIFGALAKGKSIISNFSKGEDPRSTLQIIRDLGVDISNKSDNTLVIDSDGILKRPVKELMANNSGTTMRLMSGLLAGQNFNSVLTGDDSLSKRPMKRVIEPLTLMGASIESNEWKAPLKIYGAELHSIDYSCKISSAQVKSCVLLAGLTVKDGSYTKYSEPYLSRNHTEIMLKHMGANIKSDGTTVCVAKSELSPLNVKICGDISSAAFFIAAGLLVPNSHIIIKNVGLNPTRTGIIDAVKQMGGYLKILDMHDVCGEKIGDIEVKTSDLCGCTIEGSIIPRLIDELPVIALLAALAKGQTVIKDAQDLRNKESDRISAVVNQLRKLGADTEETADGMIINGKTELTGGVEVDSYRDHRIAMMLYIAGMICKKEISIKDFECTSISFPEFEELMSGLVS